MLRWSWMWGSFVREENTQHVQMHGEDTCRTLGPWPHAGHPETSSGADPQITNSFVSNVFVYFVSKAPPRQSVRRMQRQNPIDSLRHKEEASATPPSCPRWVDGMFRLPGSRELLQEISQKMPERRGAGSSPTNFGCGVRPPLAIRYLTLAELCFSIQLRFGCLSTCEYTCKESL